MNIHYLSRQRIDTVAWDECVAASANQIVYGYSWYLDAVTSAPGWMWGGLVISGETAGYLAVMPVPLRRKRARWVVHQPWFCQFIAVYSRQGNPDIDGFFRAMQQRFRYGSILHCRHIPDDISLQLQTRPLYTHTLDLSLTYAQLARNYSRDRVLNLRRAEAQNWQITPSGDPELLIRLFMDHHAAGMPNGVSPSAYPLFRTLFTMLQTSGLVTLLYASQADQIQAGALFMRAGNRIIYLFNAASDAGRRGNARTLLIDRVIREYAEQKLIFDFESPEKSSVIRFYESFGAMAEPFWEVRYNRLTWLERQIQAYLNALASC